MEINELEQESKITENKNEDSKREKKKFKDQFRVVITKEANQSLVEVVRKAASGFEGGTISRSAVANYVFLNLAKYLNDSDLKFIRQFCFDETKVLTTISRKAFKNGSLPENIKRALRELHGIEIKGPNNGRPRASKNQS